MGSVRSSRSTKHTVVDVEKKGVRTHCTAAKVLVVVIQSTPKTPALLNGFLWSCEVVLKNSPKKPRAAVEALVVVRGRA